MTDDEIMDMAREAGIRVGETWAHATLETRCVLKFAGDVAARAAAEEREVCARACENCAPENQKGHPIYEAVFEAGRAALQMGAAAIRARGQEVTG